MSSLLKNSTFLVSLDRKLLAVNSWKTHSWKLIAALVDDLGQPNNLSAIRDKYWDRQFIEHVSHLLLFDMIMTKFSKTGAFNNRNSESLVTFSKPLLTSFHFVEVFVTFNLTCIWSWLYFFCLQLDDFLIYNFCCNSELLDLAKEDNMDLLSGVSSVEFHNLKKVRIVIP